MLKKIIQYVKSILNDIDYQIWVVRIMYEALEYHDDVNFVEECLKANYKNHYEK